MLVEGEIGVHPQTVQLVAQIGTPHQALLVQLQAVAVADQKNLLYISVLRSVEALEAVALQVQRLVFHNAARTVLQDIFYLVGQS